MPLWRIHAALENADHVLDVIGVGVLATQRLRCQSLALVNGLIPIQHHIVVLQCITLLPPSGCTTLLNSTETKPARETVAAAALGHRGGVQATAPADTLLTVIDAVAAVDGHVDLDHSRAGLEAQFAGGRARVVVGAVGVIEDEEAAAGGEGGVEEDGVGGGDGVVFGVGGLLVEIHPVCFLGLGNGG